MTILISSPATDGCLRTVSFCSVSCMTGGGCCCGCCCCCCCSCWPSPPPLLENELRLPLDSAADRKLLMSGLLRYRTDKTSLNQNLNSKRTAKTIRKKKCIVYESIPLTVANRVSVVSTPRRCSFPDFATDLLYNNKNKI